MSHPVPGGARPSRDEDATVNERTAARPAPAAGPLQPVMTGPLPRQPRPARGSDPGSADAATEGDGSEGPRCYNCDELLDPALSFCTACGTPAGPDPLVGKNLDDRYAVIRRLGAGAMGAVYEVRHLRLGKRFAMKVIRGELAQTAEFAARFEREALSTSRLEHPNCIAVTDFGHAGSGELYLVMEFLEGKSLHSLRGQPLPVGKALDIVRQTLLGLQHAHQAGVIHRDVKPENVMLLEAPDGGWLVKVLDFGIAKLPRTGGSRGERLTEAGVVFGTPEYMAPEQAVGDDVDGRADLYAVGVILWNLLTGRALFEAENHVELLGIKLSTRAPSLGRVAPGVFSVELERVVARALEKNPRDRFQSAEEFLDALGRVQRAAGGGLAVAAPWTTKVTQLARRATGLYGGWYRCEGLGRRPTWALRARGLVATGPGRIVLGSGVGGVALLALVVALALPGGDVAKATGRAGNREAVATHATLPAGETPRTRGAGGARSAGVGKGSGAKASPRVAEPAAQPRGAIPASAAARIERVRMFLARQYCREASLDLLNLVREQPSLAYAHYLLGAAQICRKLHAEGLAAYARAIELDGRYRHDARVLEDARALVEVRKVRVAALEFLGKRVGTPALETLLRATASRDFTSRQKAVEMVLALNAGRRIDWVRTLSLDLEQLQSCAARGQVVARLRQTRDRRAIPVLKAAREARTGFFRNRYRHACIRKELGSALEYLAANAKDG
ncbi:MAG: serine/threonine protein kinase [Deltaproteobacteria bacterium]|nr:serine/threonine protein kinase [Deltaproteobacteria bacterium]